MTSTVNFSDIGDPAGPTMEDALRGNASCIPSAADVYFAAFRVRYPNGCDCDICTGVKPLDDNWCPRCGENQLQPPKWWENLDVCAECEGAMGWCVPPSLQRWADDGGRGP